MSIIATARCRLAQVFIRQGRRLHPPRKQTLETGAGAVFSVGQLLRDRELRKPLVVLGEGEQRARFRLLHALDESGVEYAAWDELPPEPTADDGERISLAWQSEGCDCFIAMGDSAVLDVTKAAAARSVCRSRSILEMAGNRRVPRRKLPTVIAIPTVAGAGAEAMGAAVIMDAHQNRFLLEDEVLMPVMAVMDPEMLADAPREKVADAGLDGLCLAIEAFLAAPHGDNNIRNQAAEAVELFLADLIPCWNSGGSVKERAELLAASRLAGRAASAAGFGYARAAARAVQAVCGMPLREVMGVVLSATLEKYGRSARDELALLSVLADVTTEGSREERTAELIAQIRNMIFRMGLPDELEGVTAEQAAEIADLAAAAANPRYISPVVWDAEQFHELILSICARPDRERD